ncbi:hypothetical protein [Paenibacillus rhizophilus]|uniref:Uncharacterized protein n=1 Tax=Paenibacillus rhizophilus TaxID=1850366 RepID=A0A3N9P4E7_9BACL|nr:hypothetical protein [Paenibacillus rhizophilus]RQW09944.1 hypothetical protein EH198_17855 [Paenibacillus rhizophilus]
MNQALLEVSKPINLSQIDILEIRTVLNGFGRAELLRTAGDYAIRAAYRKQPCPATPSEVLEMTDSELRKFIFETDYPGYKW